MFLVGEEVSLYLLFGTDCVEQIKIADRCVFRYGQTKNCLILFTLYFLNAEVSL